MKRKSAKGREMWGASGGDTMWDKRRRKKCLIGGRG